MSGEAHNSGETPHPWRLLRAIGASDLPGGVKAVLRALVAYADARGRCWPSVRRLAWDLGSARPTVRKRLAEAERARVLEIERSAGGRTADGSGRPHHFRICLDKLDALARPSPFVKQTGRGHDPLGNGEGGAVMTSRGRGHDIKGARLRPRTSTTSIETSKARKSESRDEGEARAIIERLTALRVFPQTARRLAALPGLTIERVNDEHAQLVAAIKLPLGSPGRPDSIAAVLVDRLDKLNPTNAAVRSVEKHLAAVPRHTQTRAARIQDIRRAMGGTAGNGVGITAPPASTRSI